ncbi:hypothetical protein WICMUC_004981 [Wickerhamomyces mucosus]|uniref:Heat shock transcription factor n=1 Tax=Wickerhamomyces mucosus TaxID=1378264 RepID=A0A9P8T8I4_9ASCO|nr:hypothetical protein WICMUC_004981 [Wickerhamomyces mucosus]
MIISQEGSKITSYTNKPHDIVPSTSIVEPVQAQAVVTAVATAVPTTTTNTDNINKNENGNDNNVIIVPDNNNITSNNVLNSSDSSSNLKKDSKKEVTILPSNAKGLNTVFIHKLYNMLEDNDLKHLIWWSKKSDSFFIVPGEEFSKALPQYFKHTNVASFVRQLNMYGFHKVSDSNNTSNFTNETTTWEFRHSSGNFRKGDVDGLKTIKRRSSKHSNGPATNNSNNGMKTTSSSHMDLISDVESGSEKKLSIHTDTSDLNHHSHNHNQTYFNPQQQQYQHQHQQQSQQPQPQPQHQHLQYQQFQQYQHQQQPNQSNLINNPNIPESLLQVRLSELDHKLTASKHEHAKLQSKYDVVIDDLSHNDKDLVSILDLFQRLIRSNIPETNNSDEISSPRQRDEGYLKSKLNGNDYKHLIELDHDLNNFKNRILKRLSSKDFNNNSQNVSNNQGNNFNFAPSYQSNQIPKSNPPNNAPPLQQPHQSSDQPPLPLPPPPPHSQQQQQQHPGPQSPNQSSIPIAYPYPYSQPSYPPQYLPQYYSQYQHQYYPQNPPYQSTYDQPPYGQPPYGQPHYGQPPYEQPPYEQLPHAQPPFGQSQAPPMSYQPIVHNPFYPDRQSSNSSTSRHLSIAHDPLHSGVQNNNSTTLSNRKSLSGSTSNPDTPVGQTGGYFADQSTQSQSSQLQPNHTTPSQYQISRKKRPGSLPVAIPSAQHSLRGEPNRKRKRNSSTTSIDGSKSTNPSSLQPHLQQSQQLPSDVLRHQQQAQQQQAQQQQQQQQPQVQRHSSHQLNAQRQSQKPNQSISSEEKSQQQQYQQPIPRKSLSASSVPQSSFQVGVGRRQSASPNTEVGSKRESVYSLLNPDRSSAKSPFKKPRT